MNKRLNIRSLFKFDWKCWTGGLRSKYALTETRYSTRSNRQDSSAFDTGSLIRIIN
ncbi:unnamed protein product, partial [Hymenolepis diminuta]